MVRHPNWLCWSRIFMILSVLLCSTAALADDSIVWLADGVSMAGLRGVELYPVVSDTGRPSDDDIALSLTQTIRRELENAGIEVVDLDLGTPPNHLGVQIYLLHLETGSVGGRWIGLGGGAAFCILRTHIIDGASGEVVGDIIVGNVVDRGGLFSAGADDYVPQDAAEQTAHKLAELLGVMPKPDKEESSWPDD